MDLKILENTPSWEWPVGADQYFLKFLGDDRAAESDRCLAAELAGDYTVINDEIAHALLLITGNPHESEKLRGNSVISLGTCLAHVDMMEFEDADDIMISEKTFNKIQEAAEVLGDLIDDDDQEIADAVYEALAMAEALDEIDNEDENDELLK